MSPHRKIDTTPEYVDMSKQAERKCPRCSGTKFYERDCGPDSYEDDVAYTSYVCEKCGLWYDGWQNQWLVYKDGSNIDTWAFSSDEVVEYSGKMASSKPKTTSGD